MSCDKTDRTTAPLMTIAQHDAGALRYGVIRCDKSDEREIKMRDICDKEATILVGWEIEKVAGRW